MIQVDYTYTRHGWRAASARSVALQQQAAGGQLLVFALNVVASMAVGFWVMAVIYLVRHGEFGFAHAALIVAPPVAALALFLRHWSVRRRQVAVLEDRGFPQSWRVEIQADGLHFHGPVGSQTIQWSFVSGVTTLPAHLAIELATMAVIAIPLEALDVAGVRQAFVSALQHHVQMANGHSGG